MVFSIEKKGHGILVSETDCNRTMVPDDDNNAGDDDTSDNGNENDDSNNDGNNNSNNDINNDVNNDNNKNSIVLVSNSKNKLSNHIEVTKRLKNNNINNNKV